MRTSATAVLSVGENGQVTIPAEFRKTHALSRGAKVVAVAMGDALVMVPHDGVLEAICLRLEAALKGSGQTLEDLKGEALRQRGNIASERYTAARAPRRSKG